MRLTGAQVCSEDPLCWAPSKHTEANHPPTINGTWNHNVVVESPACRLSQSCHWHLQIHESHKEVDHHSVAVPSQKVGVPVP